MEEKIKSKPKSFLKWKEETTPAGNVVKVANISGTLKRISELSWPYTNSEGTVINYKLATITYPDYFGTLVTEENVKVYEKSYSQGMEQGQTYLGRVQRGTNADGTKRNPWVTLYSAVVGTSLSDDDYGDAELEIANELTVE
jgi:hypothetical protein